MRVDARLRRQPPLRVHHHPGADLHGRPLPADRQAREQAAGDEPDLVQGHAQRDQPGALRRIEFVVQRAHDLGDAGPQGAGNMAARPPQDGHRQQRGPQQCQVATLGARLFQLAEGMGRRLGQKGETDDDQSRGCGIGQDDAAVDPLSPRQ